MFKGLGISMVLVDTPGSIGHSFGISKDSKGGRVLQVPLSEDYFEHFGVNGKHVPCPLSEKG